MKMYDKKFLIYGNCMIRSFCQPGYHNLWLPGMTKNTSHTFSIYGKMLVIHFPCNSIRTENCMKGL